MSLGALKARRGKLLLRAAAQRADLARHFGGLAAPLAWVDRGMALAAALRRGVGVWQAFSGLREMFSRPSRPGG